MPQRHVEAVRACDTALQQSLDARAASSRPVVAFRTSAVEPTAATDELSSSSDEDSPAAPVKRPPRPVSFVSGAGRVSLTPRRLPRLDNVPKYMTWSMITENTLIQARAAAPRPRSLLTLVAQRRRKSSEGCCTPTKRAKWCLEQMTVTLKSRCVRGLLRQTPGVLTSPDAQVDDSAEQRAWSRQEDFLIMSTAAQLGSGSVRSLRCASLVRRLTKRDDVAGGH